MRITFVTVFLVASVLLLVMLLANTASAVCVAKQVVGEVEILGPIDCGTVTNLGTGHINSVVNVEGPRPCMDQSCGGGTLINTGTINVGAANRNSGELNVHFGNLTNDGAININGTLKPDGTADPLKSGTVIIAGTSSYGLKINNGTINMAPGSTLTLQSDGTISGSGTVNMKGGTLSGTGTIQGAVINSGGVVQHGTTIAGAPRFGIPSRYEPTALTFGSYMQSGNGRLDLGIGGLMAGTQYDVVKVNGPISINGGSIAVSLFNNFQPKVGDKFSILTGDIQRISLSSPISLPTLPGGEFWGRANFGSFFELSVQQVQPPVVGSPEPGSFLLIGSGFAWLVGCQWRKHARSVRAARS